MDDDDSGTIEQIEGRIEKLCDSIERCRKLSLAAKAAIALGALWLGLTLLWLVPYVPFMTIGALAAMIGGVVLLGSNATTWTQAESALRTAEAMRAELIERIDLRLVGEESPTIH